MPPAVCTALYRTVMHCVPLLYRTGIQFHWENGGYDSFEDFLGVLRQSKRKAIRQVRAPGPAAVHLCVRVCVRACLRACMGV